MPSSCSKPGTTATEDELQAWCKERIAGYKVPKSIEFRTEPLPLSGAMKVLKRELPRPVLARPGALRLTGAHSQTLPGLLVMPALLQPIPQEEPLPARFPCESGRPARKVTSRIEPALRPGLRLARTQHRPVGQVDARTDGTRAVFGT